jgi:hypothetical protein
MTRSNTLLNDVNVRISQTADQYRLARASLVSLTTITGDESWVASIKELDRSDIQGLTDEDEGGEGRKRLKWIWTTPGTTDDAEESTQSGESFIVALPASGSHVFRSTTYRVV